MIKTVKTFASFAPETVEQLQREGHYVLGWKHRNEERYSLLSADKSLDTIRLRYRTAACTPPFDTADFAIARPLRGKATKHDEQ